MKLMPKKIGNLFSKFPLGSQRKKGKDARVVVKYFNPSGTSKWLITEGEQLKDGDWLMYGYFYIFGWDWGYVKLSELEDFINPHGEEIERDLYIGYPTISEALSLSSYRQRYA